MIETLLRRIARSLDKAEIPYMVIGGQAVLLYGTPRLTRDIDITLGVDTDEDVIIHKVFAGRPVDLEDVKNILLKLKARLDIPYIKRWLSKFGESERKKFLGHFNRLLKR